MSLITDPRVARVRIACKEAGVKCRVAARPSKDDPSGRKLYFKLSGAKKASKVYDTGRGDAYARSCVLECFPNAYVTSGCWGVDDFSITLTESTYGAAR